MKCEVQAIINKDEQYARGWLRLHASENTSTAAEIGKYALDLLKLKNAHTERCPWCKQTSRRTA